EVTFADGTAPVTTATFSALGDYSLKLTTNLGTQSASDTLKVKVVSLPSAAPLEPVETLPYEINRTLWHDSFKSVIVTWMPHCIGMFIAVQEPYGYLQTRFTLGIPQDKDKPAEHWNSRTRGEHEGYVAGYFIEAAIAHYNMTDGKDRRLYDAAKKLADCWYNNI